MLINTKETEKQGVLGQKLIPIKTIKAVLLKLKLVRKK
jgi:hypothetical protein